MGKNTKLKCLVFGGCGFIGSHLVDHLMLNGYLVKVFDKTKVNTNNIQRHLNSIELVRGDFANKEDLKLAIRGTDYIFHLIGTTVPQSATQNPIYDLESNVISTINMLEIAKTAGIKKIIFASSGGTIYGIPQKVPLSEIHPTDPISAYGISKLIVEKYLQLYWHLHGLPYVSLRIANAYGERQEPEGTQGAIAVFLGKIFHGEPVRSWGDGRVVRDYIHVKDIVAAFLAAMETEQQEHRIFNIGSGKGLSLNDLVAVMKRISASDFPVQYTEARKIDVPVNVLDISLAKSLLNWEPRVPLEEGLRRVCNYLRMQSEKGEIGVG